MRNKNYIRRRRLKIDLDFTFFKDEIMAFLICLDKIRIKSQDQQLHKSRNGQKMTQ